MPYFPMFVDLEKKKCVIVGGGLVALRKIEALLDFNAEITVITNQVCNEVHKLEHKINLLIKHYETDDIKDAFLVIAATNDNEINKKIAKDAKSRNIPVNVVDEKEECTFIFPAYVIQKDVVIGISSSGKSPIISQKVKKLIKEALPPYIGELNHILGKVRNKVKDLFETEEERKRVFNNIVELGFAKEGDISPKEIEKIISEEKAGKE